MTAPDNRPMRRDGDEHQTTISRRDGDEHQTTISLERMETPNHEKGFFLKGGA